MKKPQFIAFGNILAELRKARNLSRYAIEKGTGQSRANIKQMEEGKLHASDNALKEIAPALGESFERLKALRIISELTPAELAALKAELCK